MFAALAKCSKEAENSADKAADTDSMSEPKVLPPPFSSKPAKLSNETPVKVA